MKPIRDVAETLGLDPRRIEPYGEFKAKVLTGASEGLPLSGRLILVSAITPTPAGEGKTTTAIGLAQGLARIGVRSAAALREPSLGPYLGIKGGGTGGGKSQVLPADEINLHFTGDMHAVSAAHNLLAALVDNQMHQGNPMGLEPRRVLWRRVMDMNDRALRHIVIGLGGYREGIPRETGFDITAASEVMAILCLARGVEDLKDRLARIVVGFRGDGRPVRAADVKGVGAMAVLLRDALKPNLVQTSEGVPALVHGGPFANIAHGTNSVAATRLALQYAEAVVTEAGFAFELGAEKFFDITCPYGGFAPCCTVLVATVRALKYHGGAPAGRLGEPDPAAVVRGFPNLEKHVENIRKFEQPCVVAVNRFPGDTDEEIGLVRRRCVELGLTGVEADPFGGGGAGCVDLAEAVWATAQRSEPRFRPLYDWNEPIEAKVRTIAREMYGAEAVDYPPRARRDLALLARLGFDRLPVCIAKTQQSLSDNPALLGRPKDFLVTVREIQLAAGAGFVIPITGEILRMPGLPAEPLAERFDLTADGEIAFH